MTVGLIGSIGTADGSSLVKLGKTTVIAGAKAEVGKPTADPYSPYSTSLSFFVPQEILKFHPDQFLFN